MKLLIGKKKRKSEAVWVVKLLICVKNSFKVHIRLYDVNAVFP